VTQNSTAFTEAFAQWNRSHTGPFVELGLTNIGWFRLDPSASVFEDFPDPAAGPDTAHMELVFGAGIGGIGPSADPPGHHMAIGLAVVAPVSRGTITLNSSNPHDPPLIDPGLLTSDFDIYAARAAVQRALRVVTAPVFKDYIIAPLVDVAGMTQDELDQFIRNSTGSTSHLVGSAAMSARDAAYGVVDPDLRVKGTEGLRVIDASVLPIVPSAHTQAATYVIAERGADLVKASWT